jgi:phosphoglycerate dehydrogenase-like enzyme
MRVAVLDDYQGAVPGLACVAALAGHDVVVHRERLAGAALARRPAGVEAVVLIRERTVVDAALLERLPSLRLIAQTGAGTTHVDVEACTARSDVVSLHLRLTAETRGLLTPALLARMKPTALLVNTARAALVAPGALAEALARGRPGAAAVDVFDEEPVPPGGEPLLALDNALCTPHLGFVTRESYELYLGRAFAAVNAFAAGAPVDVVNPEVLAR